MAGVLGLGGRFGQIVACNLRGTLVASCRPAHYWNKDWAPKARPETEEERRAAAKKYGMIPEDYETRDDSEGLTWGDYPKLPIVPAAGKDPDEDYDFPFMRRNYGEPIDIYMDSYTMERLDTTRQRTPPIKQAAMFLGTVLGLWFLATLFDHPKLQKGFNPDLGPPQMPNDGVVHYTFDPAQ